ncbi:MAG: hypothetical protein KC492_43470, partial [Myxococcales bacterium]|nr:hypothetical protein [Myxococcales bacterium]
MLTTVLAFAMTSPAASPASGDPSLSADQAVADLYVALLQDAILFADRDPVTVLAGAGGWRQLAPNESTLANAKVAYRGEWKGHSVLVAGDGGSHVFSIMVEQGFTSDGFVRRLRESVSAVSAGGDASLGQQSDIYRLDDHGSPVGLLLVTYGTATAVAGRGSVGFISVARAEREGLGHLLGGPTPATLGAGPQAVRTYKGAIYGYSFSFGPEWTLIEGKLGRGSATLICNAQSCGAGTHVSFGCFRQPGSERSTVDEVLRTTNGLLMT